MNAAAREFFHHESCMGTVFRFGGRTPFDSAKTKELAMSACEILHEADRTFSLYKPESPLSRLARGEAAVRDLPSVVSKIWDACEAWEAETDGWFSAFTPQHTFDPSGLVKTWAAQEAANYLVEHGLVDLTMNAGGDVWISDDATGEADWRIGLHKPVSIASPEAGTIAVVDLKGTVFRGVATSGSAERGLHIWNPKAPEKAAANELLQVSVVARDLVTADVWATAAFAMGNRAIGLINRYNEANPDKAIEAFAVSTAGQTDQTGADANHANLNELAFAATDGFSALFAK